MHLRKTQIFLCCLSWNTSYPSLFSILHPTLLIFTWSDLRCLWNQSGLVKHIRYSPLPYFTFLKLTQSTSTQSQLNWLHKPHLELVYGSCLPQEFGLCLSSVYLPSIPCMAVASAMVPSSKFLRMALQHCPLPWPNSALFQRELHAASQWSILYALSESVADNTFRYEVSYIIKQKKA